MSEEVEVALRKHLLAAPAVAALLATRLYPLVLPQQVQLPAVTYQGISARVELTADSAGGFERPRVQVDAWGRTWAEARELARAVQDALHGLRGLAGGRRIGVARAMRGPDDYEDELNADGTRGRYRVSTDYFLAHGES